MKNKVYRWFLVDKDGNQEAIFRPYASRLHALLKTTEALHKAVNRFGLNNGGSLELWRLTEDGGLCSLRIPIKE